MMNNEIRFCLSRKTSIPPGGFDCICPTTDNVLIRGADFAHLVANCNRYLVDNGKVPPPDLEAQVENAMCNRRPGYKYCKPCQKIKQNITFGAIVRWVKAMYEFATKNKMQFVPQEEANRRAAICAKCPLQADDSGCWGCKGIAGLPAFIVEKRTTPFDGQLKACGVCSCYNAISVHLPVSVGLSEGLEFPEWCWKSASSVLVFHYDDSIDYNFT